MKVKLILLTIAFQTIHSIYGQLPFQKIFGGAGLILCVKSNSSQITSDKGYIFAGDALVKTDSVGNLEWAKTYQGVLTTYFNSVKQTYDGGFIACGMLVSFTGTEQDFYVVRTNSLGDTLWTRAFGGPLDEAAFIVELTPDTGYLIGGSSDNFNAGLTNLYDGYIIKMNDQGDTVWTRCIPDAGVPSIKQTVDGNFIITGSYAASGNIYLTKMNPTGDTIWSKTYGSASYSESGRDVIQTSDGGYAIIGEIYSPISPEILLVKTDSIGDIQWVKRYGNSPSDHAAALKQTSDGGYILTGRAQSMASGGIDIFLMRTDAAGDTLWMRAFGGNDLDWAYSLDITDDDGYIITGQTLSFPTATVTSYAYMIKTDSNGNVPCHAYPAPANVSNPVFSTYPGLPLLSAGGMYYETNITVASMDSLIHDSLLCITTGITEMDAPLSEPVNIFPNPVQDVLNLKNFNALQLKNIFIYNTLGKKVKTFKAEKSIFIGDLPKGLYLVQLQSDAGLIYTQKIILQ